jgi:hypothetical protein
MLNWQFVLQRIKEELSLPFQVLEKSDEEIIDYCKRNALKEFEMYFPEKWRLTLNCDDPEMKVPDRSSEFYLVDPDDREIKNIIDVYPGYGPTIMTGHPYMGAWTFAGLEEWMLSVYKANMLKPFSHFNYTHEFMPPNMLRISPKFDGACVVAYERSHDPELSSLDPNLHNVFIDLCYGKFAMMIGRLRKKYNSYTTPFGEINVNGDDIYNDGKEVYDRTLEAMKNGSLPNVVFVSG